MKDKFEGLFVLLLLAIAGLFVFILLWPYCKWIYAESSFVFGTIQIVCACTIGSIYLIVRGFENSLLAHLMDRHSYIPALLFFTSSLTICGINFYLFFK